MTWFNPPYCMSVETKIGHKFLAILDSSFPVGNPLRKVLNRHTVQLSYRTMPNSGKIIAGHNAKVLDDNCRGGTKKCPMEGARCLDTCSVYQATVSAVGKVEETYIGLWKPPFKSRYGNHKSTFKHSHMRMKTTLAGYIWKLQDEGVPYNIKWETKKCRLCLMEKVKIMHTGATHNKRTEFFSSSRHKEGLLV